MRGSFRTGVNTPQLHDSAHKHVDGSAAYIDDIPEPADMLHAALVLSPIAHGRLNNIDISRALATPGVISVITAADIPGKNDVAPIASGEPLFAAEKVEYAGQPIAAVAAETRDQALAAAKLITAAIEPLPAILTIAQALEAKSFLCDPQTLESGNVAHVFARSQRRLHGEFSAGGQEHFYLEGQIAIATPGEDNTLLIHSATQHPSEVQTVCGRLLGIELNRITSIVRRLGGGFGGKESNTSWYAGVAALLAQCTRRPVKIRLPRDIDMITTGKRHGFLFRYDVAFDDDGRILALDALLAANGGCTLDHTGAVLTRAVTHVDNCYWIPNYRVTGVACKTHTVSNTAFRGYGGPQGVLLMEEVIEGVARILGKSPEAVRTINYYGDATSNVTPYGQLVKDNLIAQSVAQVMSDGGWNARRQAVDAFNRSSPIVKRGLGLFPLKYGISFTKAQLNQAGALVHVYKDGSIRLSHGGTEMGQGLFIKVAQVVAEVFQVDIDRIALSPTSTGEVPNTSPTAGSTGSDLNGWAAHAAASVIKKRMTGFAAEKYNVAEQDIQFRDNHIHIGLPGSNKVVAFDELALQCWMGRVSLSSTGFYKTPDITWDGAKMRGNPFFYFSYGAATAEVAIDTLTGELRVLRADLVQDCGRSLNPMVDLGQIEGGFVQGMGWLIHEELWWDGEGRLRTIGPSTYKIPGSRDVPAQLNTRILENVPARAATVFASKGIGEPPVHLATAIWTACKDAVGSIVDHKVAVSLDLPMTPERVLDAVKRTREQAVVAPLEGVVQATEAVS
jgi:xanthine dehydrogenase large subunit